MKEEDLNLRNSVGDTPLHVAIKENNYPVVELLLRNNASLYVPNGKNESAVQLARRLSNEAIGAIIDRRHQEVMES